MIATVCIIKRYASTGNADFSVKVVFFIEAFDGV